MSVSQVDHKYFSLILNIIDEILKDPFEMRLYIKYKRIAGDSGACFKSNNHLAAECGMSKSQLIRTKKKLAQPRKELGGKSLITIKIRFKDDGNRETDSVVINDLWAENAEFFKNISKGSVTGTPGIVSDIHEGSVPGTPKEEPFKKNPSEEYTSSLPPQKKPPLKYRTKEEIWRGFFLDSEHREIFDAAWEEYKKQPPGSVKHLIGWLRKVCIRISIEMFEIMEVEERTKRHKDEARSRDNFGEKNTIVAGEDSVELVFGVKSIFVKYDVSDNEWQEKTDLIFGKRDKFEFVGL